MNKRKTIKCLFCQQELDIQMYMSDCDNCHMRYMSIQFPPDWDTFHIVAQDYKFNGLSNEYHSLIMDLRKNESVLWVYGGPEADSFKMDKMVIPHIWPDTKPEEALQLAKRLHNLSAFS